MKKQLGMIAVLCCLLLAMMTPTATAVEKKTEWPLYKVTYNHHELYILGTVHVGTKEMYPFPREIQRALKRSTSFVTEVELAKGERPAEQLMRLPDGQTIDQLLTPQSQLLLRNKLAKLAIPIQWVETLRPWALEQFIRQITAGATKFSGQYGVDVQLYQMAKKMGKVNIGLETAGDQYYTMSLLTPDEEANAVVEHLNVVPQRNESGIEALLLLYQTGQLTKMNDNVNNAQQSDYEQRKAERLQQYALKARNEKWFPKLEQLIQSKKTTFAAIGALHLFGSDGVLTYFANKQYKIEKVSVHKQPKKDIHRIR